MNSFQGMLMPLRRVMVSIIISVAKQRNNHRLQRGHAGGGRKGSHQLTNKQKAEIYRALPSIPSVGPLVPRRVLIFCRCEGYIHTSIPFGNHALVELGNKTGAYVADLADSYEVFNLANLNHYDLVVFNNTTNLRFEDSTHREALIDFIRNGKGIVGIHAATDNFYTWPEAIEMMGGAINGHPWGERGTWAFKLNEPEHPINAAFQEQNLLIKDEIYQYKPDTFAGADKLRILVSLDMEKKVNQQGLNSPSQVEFNKLYGDGPREVPVSWCRSYGKGRLFYSSFGHNQAIFRNPTILKHFLDGIQFALGDLPAETTPSCPISS